MSSDTHASPATVGAPETTGISTEVATLYGDALDRAPALAPRRSRRRFGNLLRFLPYLRPYATRFALMVVFAIASTIAGIVTPLVTQRVVDGPISNSAHRGLYTLGSAAIAIGVVEAVFMFWRRWVVARGTLGTETGIRLDLYAKLQRLPLGFHTGWESGQLLSRIMNDLSTVRRFLGFGLLFLIMNLLQIVITTGLLLNMYWPLGLVVVISAVPIVWLCLVNERRYTKLSRTIQDQTGDVASAVEESVGGLRVIKAFGRRDHIFGGFDDKAVALWRTSMARVRLTSWFWTVLEAIPSLTLVVVLAFGALAVGHHRISLGTLVAFITLMLSIVWPIASLGFLLSMTQDSMTAADRICEIFDAPETIRDGARSLDHPSGRLTFDDVTFRYPDGHEDVLKHLDLDIEPGQTVALVGGTGSGKTTLTALVPRLADVTGGAIRIDGVDIRDLRVAELRSIVATAFEDATLFSMSVRENLTLGRADASQEEIDEAIDVAQAGFVHDLPWGLDTRIGEQGMSLSGGQRQRLALARAVLVRPRILVLDDTLSALDMETEALVESALKRVLVDVTGIVVAHRASTVLLADKVAMLSEGRVTHVGTHAELLATVPEYRELLSADYDAETGIASKGDRERGGEDQGEDREDQEEVMTRG
ncbi:MAG: ABC transporter ATP-binding protein [Acidipropionibacterium acidipropionici]|jgi:ATP-binding cassette subfamily B protein|uniref:ABC transporter ATP-binding protein n=1 Tax=Acidipropionibacterium acidipropionici TaxID=1748 RepID=UPI00110AED18|nr:ABC transporter ATP-binding protein [Acidipropionibacterium acidipropionici]QCV93907.1 ABC transporter ATP-binding protein [Acidipropionibacterium acidipropionici]